jgi:hypothetical protein
MNEIRDLTILSEDQTATRDTRVIAARVAKEYALRGRESALSFLRGVWYMTGVRNYLDTQAVSRVFGLSVSDL